MINDINPELINTYIQIRDNKNSIIALFSDMQDVFLKMNDEQRGEYFYLQRDKFNGLYRVNSKELYNVPVGFYKNPLICDEETLGIISKLLQNVETK